MITLLLVPLLLPWAAPALARRVPARCSRSPPCGP
ncbi:hypothetical protein SGRIM119S_03743 [Streptomyces griseorubiginosus]